MESVTLKAEKRDPAGSRAAGRLRRKGLVPAIIYGHGETPVPVALNGELLTHTLRHGAHLLDLEIDGDTQKLLVKDVQFNYLGDTIVHVDLARVNLDERVTVTVQLNFRHEPIGVTEDEGQFLTPVMEVEVECLVTAIPDEIRVECRDLRIGDSITIADLVLPEGVVCTEPADLTVASVVQPREEEEAPAEAGEVSAEPELIGRKAEEGEEGEEPKGEKKEG